MPRRLFFELLVAGLALVLLASCAKERPPRSYLQPNVIKKSDMTGQWYYSPTVIDVGYGSNVTFVGEVGFEIHIIEWDIQENVIYARLAYDRIENTESVYGGVDGVAYAGEPIAAWKVEHFDIIRDYNATTGEETNVLKETKERPWYDREFVRVDWTENLISNWNLMWRRAVSLDPVNYHVTDPDHPHAPRMERGTDGKVDYIGITSKLIVSPMLQQIDWVDWYGLTELPDCYFYGTTVSCTSTEIVMRHAFAKKDPDREYHPREYSQKEQEDYGYFLTRRLNYNREYGVTVGGLRFYANRFNLYGEWYRKAMNDTEAGLHAGARPYSCENAGEPCRYSDAEGGKVFIKARQALTSADLPPGLGPTDAFCRCDGQGPDCEEPCFYVADGTPVMVEDPDGEENYLLRPFERPLRPVVYYLNDTFPEALIDTVRDVAGQWADVLNRSVWMAAGCDPGDYGSLACANRPEFDDDAFSMLVLCENPVVQEGDPPECGTPNTLDPDTGRLSGGRKVSLGDIRWNQLVWVDSPHQDAPLGYGPPLADPLTGETVSAISNVYGPELDSYSRYAMEIARIVTDDNFPWADYLWSRFQVERVRENLQGGLGFRQPEPAGRNKVGEVPASRTPSWSQRTYTQADITKLYQQMNKGFTYAVPGSAYPPPERPKPHQLRQWVAHRNSLVGQSNVLGNGINPQNGRLNLLRGSFYEDMMMTPDYLLTKANSLRAAGYDPISVTGADLPPGSSIRRQISPLTRLNVNYLRAINKRKKQHYARTIMYPEMVPFQEPSVQGLAAEMVCSLCCATPAGNGNCPNVNTCIQDRTAQTQRWAEDSQCESKVAQRIRELVFAATTLHEMGHNMGLRHNFKGSYDAMNYFDRYWEIRKLDGTIGPRTSDPMTQQEILEKITQYQYSSIMDYGGKFNSDVEGLGRYDIAAINHAYAGFTQVFDVSNDIGTVGLIQDFRNFYWPTPVLLFFAGPEGISYTQYHYDPAVSPNGAVDTNESNRSWVPRPWIVTDPFLQDMSLTDTNVEQLTGGSNTRAMVPYQFCSDEYSDIALGCNLFDEGADTFEIVENVIRRYESDYVFNNFGRDRYNFGWDEDAYAGRILWRYFEVMRNHMFDYVWFFAVFHDWGLWTHDQIQTFFTDPVLGWGTYTAAVSRTFETFTRALFVPQPGCYHQRDRNDGTPYWFMDAAPEFCLPGDVGTFYDFQIDYIDGKHWDDEWDFDFGYEWDLRQIRIGHFYDRPLAIQMLAEATNNFLGRDTQEDYRKYTINYARLFPDHINVLFTAIQSGDLSVLAPTYCGADLQGNAIVEHRDVMNLDAPRCSLTGGLPDGFLDPGDTFTTQLNAAALGMALFPMSYSREFIDQSRIYVRGSLEGIDWSNIPPSASLVTFTDPFSGKTYEAVRYQDTPLLDDLGNTLSPSIGARVLEKAADILAIYNAAVIAGDPNDIYTAEEHLRNWIENIELLRGLTYMYEHSDGTVN